MDELEELRGAVQDFNGHPTDWRRVYDYVHARFQRSERLSIDEVVMLIEVEVVEHFSEDVWSFIEKATDMLDYLRDEGRV